MLLAIDVGNSNTSVGLFDRDKMCIRDRAYDVEELFRACHDYFDKTGRRISFEYAMIDGVNDHDWQADLILSLIHI